MWPRETAAKAATMKTAVVFCAVILLRPDVSAPQAPESSAPAFEVASVKLNRSGDTRWFGSAAGRSQTVRLTNWPLSRIIAHAYGIDPGFERFKLVGGPGSILSAQFDINAKRPDGVPAEQNFAMLRTLLADRFGLKIRAETKQTPVFALTLARAERLGPALTRTSVDCAALAAGGAKRDDPDNPPDAKSFCWKSDGLSQGAITKTYAGSISELVRRIQGFVDRPLVDATGLTGSVAWQLTFASGANPNADVPGISTALEEQLGLKLQPRAGPFEVLVIESVSLPTPD